VSSILQHLRGRQLAELKDRRPEATVVDPAEVIPVMKCIGDGFTAGRATSIDQLAEVANLPADVVRQMVTRLVGAGLLHRLADSETHVTLRRPPETIRVSRLLEVAFGWAERNEGEKDEIQVLSQLRTHSDRPSAISTWARC